MPQSVTLSSVSQILIRNAHLFSDKRVLVCGAIYDTYPMDLAQACQSLTVVTDNLSQTNLLSARTSENNVHFDYLLPQEQHFDAVIIYMPKAKERARFWMAQALTCLADAGILYVVGENRSGIRSVPDIARGLNAQASKYDSARRCSLYSIKKTGQTPSFNLDDWWRSYTLTVRKTSVKIWALPGVFSQAHCDPASQLLLEHIDTELKGPVLDFGCGAGVLSAWLSQQNPECEFHLVDVDAFALASSQKTFAENNLTANIYASDVFSKVQGTFKTLITNPPFHTGLDTDYSHTQAFLQEATRYLRKKSSLYLVANRFIKYGPLMEAAFSKTEICCQNNQFSVYKAIKC